MKKTLRNKEEKILSHGMEKNIEKYKATDHVMGMLNKKLIPKDSVKKGLLEFLTADETCVVITPLSLTSEKALHYAWLFPEKKEQQTRHVGRYLKRLLRNYRRCDEYAERIGMDKRNFSDFLAGIGEVICVAEVKGAINIRYTPSTQN